MRRFFLLIILGCFSALSAEAQRSGSGARLSTETAIRPGAATMIQQGDSLEQIAHRYRLRISDLIAWNNLKPPYRLYPGHMLRIAPQPGTVPEPPPPPLPHQIDQGTPVPALPRDQVQPPIAPPLVARPPRPLQNQITEKTNHAPDPEPLFIAPISPAIALPPSPSPGPLHEGIAFAAAVGTPIRAAATGRVRFAGLGWGEFGLTIVLRHDTKWATIYADLDRFAVGTGDIVAQGQVIAYSGLGGRSSEPRLYFEIRRDLVPVDVLSRITTESP